MFAPFFIRTKIYGILASLVLVVFSLESRAQELGTLTIDQRAQQAQSAPKVTIPPEELILTGEEDLVLLRRPKLFALESNSSYQFTDNAFLSDKIKTHDHVLNQSLLVRTGTRIAQRVDVFLSGSGFLSRYQRNQGLDFNGVTGSAGANLPIGRWNFGLRYDGSAIYDRNFNRHLVTLHNLGFNISTTVGLSPSTVLYPFLSVLRVWANPDDFSYTSVAGGGTCVHAITQTLVLFFQGQVDYKSYDDFFESSTGEARQDYGARLLAALNWTPSDWVTVNVSATIARNESTISSLRYTNFLASPFVHLIWRF